MPLVGCCLQAEAATASRVARRCGPLTVSRSVNVYDRLWELWSYRQP